MNRISFATTALLLSLWPMYSLAQEAAPPEGLDKVTPEGSDKVTPEGSDKVTPEGSDKVTPEGSDKVTPEGSDKVTPEGSGAVPEDDSESSATPVNTIPAVPALGGGGTLGVPTFGRGKGLQGAVGVTAAIGDSEQKGAKALDALIKWAPLRFGGVTELSFVGESFTMDLPSDEWNPGKEHPLLLVRPVRTSSFGLRLNIRPWGGGKNSPTSKSELVDQIQSCRDALLVFRGHRKEYTKKRISVASNSSKKKNPRTTEDVNRLCDLINISLVAYGLEPKNCYEPPDGDKTASFQSLNQTVKSECEQRWLWPPPFDSTVEEIDRAVAAHQRLEDESGIGGGHDVFLGVRYLVSALDSMDSESVANGVAAEIGYGYAWRMPTWSAYYGVSIGLTSWLSGQNEAEGKYTAEVNEYRFASHLAFDVLQDASTSVFLGIQGLARLQQWSNPFAIDDMKEDVLGFGWECFLFLTGDSSGFGGTISLGAAQAPGQDDPSFLIRFSPSTAMSSEEDSK